MFENLREDLRRYGRTPRERARAFVLTPGLWAVAGYRFARWAHTARMPGPARRAAGVFATLLNLLVEVLTNIELPARAEIGPGLFIAHTGSIVLASGERMGRHCTLTQGVTIGHRGGGEDAEGECPVIGDRVYVGPGAAIVGPIRVGDDALVGVGAVVTRDVPARGVAAGNPARVISLKGSFNFIFYEGRERDPERLRALGEAEAESPAGRAGEPPRAEPAARQSLAN